MSKKFTSKRSAITSEICSQLQLKNWQNLPFAEQVLISLGDLHAHVGQYQAAGRYYQRVIFLLGKEGVGHQRIQALRKLGLVRYWSGSLASSVKLLEQAAICCEHCDCPCEEALTLGLLGHLYCQQQKYAFALAAYEAALEIAKAFPKTQENVRFQAEMQRGMGQVCEATNHLSLSLKHYFYALCYVKTANE